MNMPFRNMPTPSKEEIAQILKTSPELLDSFETAYQSASFAEESENDNFFKVNSRQVSREKHDSEGYADADNLYSRIVDELLMDRKTLEDKADKVKLEEIMALPEEKRPQLTGTLVKKDIQQPNYMMLAENYARSLATEDPRAKAQWYGLFRQGLDILDLDPIMYEMLGMNIASIGHWFPTLKEAVDSQEFFKVPETKIIKVPLPILQLTRIEYGTLTPATLKIVDDYCMKAFDLDANKTYFIKTGTYSSKFDFRNTKVKGEKEVRELGEYLLFIHSQANQMAGSLTLPGPIYGVSTTNEWCVREYIEDIEGNPCIYHGMPLHTEYRCFIDCDTDELLAVAPYWDADLMKKRFTTGMDADTPTMKHDYIILTSHQDTMMERFNENKDAVGEHVKSLIPDLELEGQWSLDIMQNGDDFWIIDMAPAQSSALNNYIPMEKRRNLEEHWIPSLEIRENILQ